MCSAEAECALSVELTARMAIDSKYAQGFRKDGVDGVDRHLDRPSPVIPQPCLHLQNFVERQKRLWSGLSPFPSSVSESDPTTAQDFESYTVVGSDSAKVGEQGGQIMAQVVSLRAIPGAGFRHLSPGGGLLLPFLGC